MSFPVFLCGKARLGQHFKLPVSRAPSSVVLTTWSKIWPHPFSRVPSLLSTFITSGHSLSFAPAVPVLFGVYSQQFLLRAGLCLGKAIWFARLETSTQTFLIGCCSPCTHLWVGIRRPPHPVPADVLRWACLASLWASVHLWGSRAPLFLLSVSSCKDAYTTWVQYLLVCPHSLIVWDFGGRQSPSFVAGLVCEFLVLLPVLGHVP